MSHPNYYPTNKRTNRIRQACLVYVRQFLPEVYQAIVRQVEQQVPVGKPGPRRRGVA
jgi:hypothetical protein